MVLLVGTGKGLKLAYYWSPSVRDLRSLALLVAAPIHLSLLSTPGSGPSILLAPLFLRAFFFFPVNWLGLHKGFSSSLTTDQTWVSRQKATRDEMRREWIELFSTSLPLISRFWRKKKKGKRVTFNYVVKTCSLASLSLFSRLSSSDFQEHKTQQSLSRKVMRLMMMIVSLLMLVCASVARAPVHTMMMISF